jgi:hypothetical protein
MDVIGYDLVPVHSVAVAAPVFQVAGGVVRPRYS